MVLQGWFSGGPVLERRGIAAERAAARATWAVVWRCLTWGLLTGVGAGAVAASMLLPGAGAAGAVAGGCVGLAAAPIPTVPATAAAVMVLRGGHRPLLDPAAARCDLARVCASLFLALIAIPAVGMAVNAAVKGAIPPSTPTRELVVPALWLAAVVIGTASFVVVMLRAAVGSILVGWSRPWGWRVGVADVSAC
jgi:hypothetical protein